MTAAGEMEHGEGARCFSPALGAGWPWPTSFPFGTNLSPLASASGGGDREHYPPPPARVTAAAGVVAFAQWHASGPRLDRPGAAPYFGVNKHKTKRKSCRFLDPSPLSFNFLASAYCCCIRAPYVKCKNKRIQASMSPASQ